MNCKSAFFGILGLFVASIIAVIYLILGWKSVGFIDEDELSERYIIKEDISFYDLPQEIQDIYVNKDSIVEQKVVTKVVVKEDKSKIEALQNENEILKNRISQLKQSNQEIKQSVKEDTKESFALYKNVPIKTIRCSDFKDSQYLITKKCQDKIDEFLTSYAKPAHFEIISMISKSDFSNFKTTNGDNKINMLIDEGLARLRAKEVGWFIRQKSLKGSFYSFPPYQFKTKATKGVVINIY